ncbi:ATP-dependent RNA helicase [Plasmodium brasilianum]|uniref:ATP-dependent RNA helicase n=1 Tax=Plasmodium brasilianum TaxID=5824 RepID=A0ACB9YBH8_PLABR|nr:ATP-dependent RNA helicase [Plasmodium brasilianum]
MRQAITFILPSEKKIAFLIYSHLKKKNEVVDKELENFILKNNLHNDIQLKRMKRKMNDALFDMPLNKMGLTAPNISTPSELAFKKISTPPRSLELVRKSVHMITPNDVLSSSDEEY